MAIRLLRTAFKLCFFVAALVPPLLPCSAEADKTVVTFAHPYGGNPTLVKAFDAAVTVFNQENADIEVKLVDYPKDLAAAAAAGSTPDVVHVGRGLALGLFQRGATLDLEPLVSKLPEWKPEEYLLPFVDSFRWHGALAALPGSTAQVPVLFWNRELFAANGLNPTIPPKDLGEALVLARKLTRRSADNALEQAGFEALYGPDPPFGIPAWFGATVYDAANDRVTVDTQPMEDMMSWLKALYDSQGGLGSKGYGALEGQTKYPWEWFADGKLGMIQNVDYLWNFFETYNPAMSVGQDLMIGGAILAPNAKGAGVQGHTDSTVVMATAKNPLAAARFAVAINFGDAAKAFARYWPVMSPSRAVDLQLLNEVDPKRRVAAQAELKSFELLQSYPFSPESNDLYTQLGQAMDDVVRGKKAPEAALKEVQSAIQGKIDSRRAREGAAESSR